MNRETVFETSFLESLATTNCSFCKDSHFKTYSIRLRIENLDVSRKVHQPIIIVLAKVPHLF